MTADDTTDNHLAPEAARNPLAGLRVAITGGTSGPQVTRAYAAASAYQHSIGTSGLNELRAGYTRRAVDRRGIDLPKAVSSDDSQIAFKVVLAVDGTIQVNGKSIA